MEDNWTAEQRRALDAALRSAGVLLCPVCGSGIARREVPAKSELPYVRRRVVLICSGCKRNAAFDAPRPATTGDA